MHAGFGNNRRATHIHIKAYKHTDAHRQKGVTWARRTDKLQIARRIELATMPLKRGSTAAKLATKIDNKFFYGSRGILALREYLFLNDF